jgi:hypothetical protein
MSGFYRSAEYYKAIPASPLLVLPGEENFVANYNKKQFEMKLNSKIVKFLICGKFNIKPIIANIFL